MTSSVATRPLLFSCACATAALLAALVLAPALALAEGGTIRGRIRPGVPGLEMRHLGPVVVYLERPDGATIVTHSLPPVEVRQDNARFSPAFTVVPAGQPIEMRNLDAIYHNVFSYSRPNEFDLGIYPAGESRRVTFLHPGVVKTYCSIHETMNGTIIVTPSPHFGIARASGRFEIRGVPAGRYVLHVWSEKLPGLSREVEVEVAEPLELDLSLGVGSNS